MKSVFSSSVWGLFFTLLPVCVNPGISTAAAPAPVASVEQLQAMFDQAQYKELVVPLNKALADKTTVAKADTHYALLMLRGETMLRMKASTSAQDAFRAASLVVGADEKSVAIARATVSLVKRSGNAKYQPKAKAENSTAQQPAIDILTADSRKQAFAALFTDLSEPAKPVVAAAEKATSLEPILAVTPQLSEMRSVEIAATGSDAQTKDLLQKLATHAADLLTAAQKPLDQSLATITTDAARKMKGGRSGSRGIAGGGGMTTGLEPLDVDKLDSDISEARSIASAADTLQSTFGDAGDFKDAKSAADKFVTEANKLLAKYKKPTE